MYQCLLLLTIRFSLHGWKNLFQLLHFQCSAHASQEILTHLYTISSILIQLLIQSFISLIKKTFSAYCQKIFAFSYSYIITSFEFRIFLTIFNTIVNIYAQLNISRHHFDSSMIRFVLFVNYFI